jgi:myosin heavy subunit
MHEIHRVLGHASRRLLVVRWLSLFIASVTGALLIALAARIVQQVFGLEWTWAAFWQSALLIGLAAAVVISAAWAFISRARPMLVAQEVDERAGLRESLSTAMHVSQSQDAWAQSVVESARERARAVDVAKTIPYELPRWWPAPIAAALSLLVVWVAVPRLDVLGLFAKNEEARKVEQEIVQVKAEVKKDQAKLEELLAKAGVEDEKQADEGGPAAEKAEKPLSADEIRRTALKQLTNLQEKLSEKQSGEKAQTLEAMKQAMKQMKSPGPGPLDELSKKMAQGKFDEASKQLEQMQQKLASGEMSPDQREQMKAQLDKMSQQMKQLAQDQKQLAKQLEQAGMSADQAKKLAEQAMANPDSFKRALEGMKNLSPEQLQKLAQMAKSQQQSQQAMDKMSQACKNMSEGMNKNGMDQQGQEAISQLASQLSEMESLEAEMKSLQAAMGECKSQMSKLGGQCKGGNCDGDGESMFSEHQSEWAQGEKKGKGKGSGGAGQGNGVSPEAEVVDTLMDKAKANTKPGQGAIIASRYVQGESIKGESVLEFSEAVSSASRHATEAIETMQVAPEYQAVVKAYFGRLAARTQATKAVDTSPSTPPASPPSSGEKK